MGTLRKKTIKGNIYYYYVESKRMDGKPKNVNQKYLGTAEALLKLKNQASAPLQDEALYSHIKSYGDVVLLYDLFARLGIVDIMDAHAAKRRQGASVGQYVMVEAINRAVSPSSTDSLQDWYAGTCLRRHSPHKASGATRRSALGRWRQWRMTSWPSSTVGICRSTMWAG